MSSEIQTVLENADKNEQKMIDSIIKILNESKGQKLLSLEHSVLEGIQRYVMEIVSIQKLRASITPT